MTKGEMREHVITYLRENGEPHATNVPTGRFDQPLLSLPYGISAKVEVDTMFVATLWGLVAEGIIVPGLVSYQRVLGNNDKKIWPFYTITSYGRKVLSGEGDTVSPRDMTRYLAEAKRRLPAGDDAIGLYLEEANRAFVAGLHLSSVVMLGISAEALTEWLILVVRKHLQTKPAALSAFDKDIGTNRRQMAVRFTRLMKEIDAHSDDLTRDLKEVIRPQFEIVLSLLKTYRDDVAHRRPFRVDPELVDGQLTLYLATLRVACELSESFSTPCALP